MSRLNMNKNPARIAKDVFAVQTKSVPSEGLFSAGKLPVVPLRVAD